MRAIYKIVIAVVAVTAFWSCRNNENDSLQLTPEISVVGDTIMEAGSCNLVFKLVSNVPWTANVDQGWCDVSPSEGDAGEIDLYVMADANERNEERNAALTIRSGSVRERIMLIQKFEESMTLSSNRFEIPQEGGSVEIRVRHNVGVECEVEGDAAAWIMPVATKAMETSVLQFDVIENETMDKREGRIKISAGDLTETVFVYQSGTEPEIVLTQNEYVVSAEGEDIEVQIKSNVSYRIELSDSWLSAPAGSSTYSQVIRVSANTSGGTRTGVATFVSDDYRVKDFVIIKQLQKGAIVLVDDSYTVSNEGGVLEFPLLANVDFEVVIPDECDWITQIPASSTAGNMEVVRLAFRVDAYGGGAPRSAEIQFVGQDVTQSVVVTQTGDPERQFVYITHSSESFATPILSGESIIDAFIDWGDGTREDYVSVAEQEHTYSDGGQYVITVESTGAEEITLRSIKNVSKVSYTYF